MLGRSGVLRVRVFEPQMNTDDFGGLWSEDEAFDFKAGIAEVQQKT